MSCYVHERKLKDDDDGGKEGWDQTRGYGVCRGENVGGKSIFTWYTESNLRTQQTEKHKQIYHVDGYL